MSPKIWSLGCVALAWAVPLGCASDDSPPRAGSSGVAGRAGGDGDGGAAPGGSSGADAAGAGASLDGGAGGEGGIGHLGLGGTIPSGGAPTHSDPACARAATWDEGVPLATVSDPDADERLLAMTHDALTVVFSRDDALFVADRASTSADFSAAVAIALPPPYGHERGVAISPDGRTLVVATDSGQRFADFSRATRSGTFQGMPRTSRYVAIAENAELFSRDLSSPVLAADGSLYYTEIGPTSSVVFHTQLLEGQDFFEAQTTPLDTSTLGSDDGKNKLTLSVSADERTLFVFDEALGYPVGFWNAVPGSPFTAPAEFPELVSVFSDANCAHLYATADRGSSLDVVVLSAK